MRNKLEEEMTAKRVDDQPLFWLKQIYVSSLNRFRDVTQTVTLPKRLLA